MSQSQKRSKNRRKAKQPAEFVGAAQEHLQSPVENASSVFGRETAVHAASRQVREVNETQPQAPVNTKPQLFQEHLISLEDAKKKEACKRGWPLAADATKPHRETVSRSDSDSVASSASTSKRNDHVSINTTASTAVRNLVLPSNPAADVAFGGQPVSGERHTDLTLTATSSAQEASANMELFCQMLLEYYTSIRVGRIAIGTDDSVCMQPIPADVRQVVAHVLADCDVLVLLALSETVLSEHVCKIRDALVSIVRNVLHSPATVSQSHAYCFVKLYLDEYRALLAGAKSVAKILTDAYHAGTEANGGADALVQKALSFDWEALNKHVFYSLVYSDELIRKYVAACVHKLNSARPRKLFTANRSLLSAIVQCAPVSLREQTAEQPLQTSQQNDSPHQDGALGVQTNASDHCELVIKCTASELLECYERVRKQLEMTCVRSFLLDTLQQTQSATDSICKKRNLGDESMRTSAPSTHVHSQQSVSSVPAALSSSHSSSSDGSHLPCCGKCGTPHRIAADAEFIAHLLAERERIYPEADSTASPSRDDTAALLRERAMVLDFTELLPDQLQLDQLLTRLQESKACCDSLDRSVTSDCASSGVRLTKRDRDAQALADARRLLNISASTAAERRQGLRSEHTESSDDDKPRFDSATDDDDDDDAHNPPPLAANAFSRSTELLDESAFLAAALCETAAADWPPLPDAALHALQVGPYYLIDTGTAVPLHQTDDQLEDFCNAIFSPAWCAPGSFVLPQACATQSSTSCAHHPSAASDCVDSGQHAPAGENPVVGHPVVINGHLWMLVNINSTELPSASHTSAHAPSTVNVVPASRPDEIVRMLCASLSGCDSAPLPAVQPMQVHVQRGVVFIDEPRLQLQLPSTDQSDHFHVKSSVAAPHLFVPPLIDHLHAVHEAHAHQDGTLHHHGSTTVDCEDADEDSYEAADDDDVAAAGALADDLHSATPHCQYCALRSAIAAGQRNQYVQRLRKKLQLQRSAEEIRQSAETSMQQRGASPEMTQIQLREDSELAYTPEAVTEAREAGVRERLSDPTVHSNANVATDTKAEIGAQERNIDELVRFIEGRSADLRTDAAHRALTSSKSEKRKRKKEKNKQDTTTNNKAMIETRDTAAEPKKTASDANCKPLDTDTTQNNGAVRKENVQVGADVFTNVVQQQATLSPSQNASDKSASKCDSKDAPKQKSEKRRLPAVTADSRSTNEQDCKVPSASVNKNERKTNTRSPSLSDELRSRKAHARTQERDGSSSNAPVTTAAAPELATKEDELVIPDFGEVHISLDSSKSKNQHKAKTKEKVKDKPAATQNTANPPRRVETDRERDRDRDRDRVADKETAVLSVKPAAPQPFASTPSVTAEPSRRSTAKLPGGPKKAGLTKQQIHTVKPSTAGTDENGNPAGRSSGLSSPSISTTAGSNSLTATKVSAVHGNLVPSNSVAQHLGAPQVHGQPSSDQRDRQMNPRYRNAIKLEAFVRSSLRTATVGSDRQPTDAVNGVRNVRNATNPGSPGARHTSESNVSTPSTGTSTGTSTFSPTVAEPVRNSRRSERARISQNQSANFGSSQTGAQSQLQPQSQSQSQSQSQRGQFSNTTQNSGRRRARNFYGPQYSSSNAQSSLQTHTFGTTAPYAYRTLGLEVEPNDSDANTLRDSYEADGSSPAGYTVYNSGGPDGANAPVWESVWLANSAAQSQTHASMAWSADDGRNGEPTLSANAFTYTLANADGTTTAATYTLESYAPEQGELGAFPFDAHADSSLSMGADRHSSTPAATFGSTYELDPACATYAPSPMVVTQNSNQHLMPDETPGRNVASFNPIGSHYEYMPLAAPVPDWSAFGDHYSAARSNAAMASYAEGEQLSASFTNAWSLPCPVDMSAQRAPSGLSVLNLKGSLFDTLPNSAVPLVDPCDAVGDNPLPDTEDDFDPEIEQFKQICMNDTATETRERLRVQVNLSEIFRKKT